MQPNPLHQIRWMLGIVMAGLILSGLTALPLKAEVGFLAQRVSPQGQWVGHWIHTVHEALVATQAQYPFLAYGTDWLAFGHFVIALFFLGPWRDPVRNLWVIDAGLLACAALVPYTLVMGGLREIPWGWRLIDCSFGVLGALPLWVARRLVHAHSRVALSAR